MALRNASNYLAELSCVVHSVTLWTLLPCVTLFISREIFQGANSSWSMGVRHLIAIGAFGDVLLGLLPCAYLTSKF